MLFEVKTSVYRTESGEFIGNSTAEIEAEDKEEARFLFYHGAILASTPKGLRITPDMRTLKLASEQPLKSAAAVDFNSSAASKDGSFLERLG